MTENRSFASLEPTLLARKGGAKPAMRPQAAQAVAAQALPALEDLGWNDMGEADEEARRHEALALPLDTDAGNGALKGKPAVRRQIEAIAAHLARDESTSPKASRAAPKAAADNGRRAAFTLRLDAQRHLKLRLACTINNRSAQQIVTEALDRMLGGMPELDTLAAQLKQR